MLLAQASAAFPPFSFWLITLALVMVMATATVKLVDCVKRADCAQRIKERELAAHLVEVMLVERKFSPEEIEQVLQSYQRLGTLWSWLPRQKRKSASSLEIPPAKAVAPAPNASAA
jgi:hypothetical protein